MFLSYACIYRAGGWNSPVMRAEPYNVLKSLRKEPQKPFKTLPKPALNREGGMRGHPRSVRCVIFTTWVW